jgi:bifunctional DNA-binding transcriptional regulator/antitoxin component of YhaV-PrlF toxin-antitoxin module
VAKNGQVVIPRDVLHAVRLKAGDSVYVMEADEPAGAILVIPVEMASRWFEAGRKAATPDETSSTT